MSISNTIGSTLGNTAAYGKHAVIRTVTGSGGFVADTYSAAVLAYEVKDAQLAERREAIKAARLAGAAQLVAPKVIRLRNLDV